jgi:hypothetical protein
MDIKRSAASHDEKKHARSLPIQGSYWSKNPAV